MCRPPGVLWVTVLWRWQTRPQPRGVSAKSMENLYREPTRYGEQQLLTAALSFVLFVYHFRDFIHLLIDWTLFSHSPQDSSWTERPLENRKAGESRWTSRIIQGDRNGLNDRTITERCSDFVSSCCRQMYSLFVGDLTPDVDDGMLYEFFYNRYPSCRGGKVVLDSMGNSK